MSRYKRLPDDQLRAVLSSFQKCIEHYLFKVKRFPRDLQYDVSPLDLIDMVIRVDKRKSHYLYAHGIEINEAKRVGLYVYWFLKFKPIRILDTRFNTVSDLIDINECFALCLIYSILLAYNRQSSFDRGDNQERNKFYDKLRYSLRFRTFTAGSMLLLVEMLW